MQVDFYQLAATPIDRVLPRLVERVLASGERLLIVADDALLTRLDALLWSYDPISFLPHARAGGDADADQPALLSEGVEAVNHATNLMLADGVWRDEALGFARSFYLFDDAALPAARTAWRLLGTRDDVDRRFWKQDDAGRWRQGP